MARVLFITGFNRSGTTLITTAVTQAASARTLTVGDLARHLPSLQRFLTLARKHGTVTDRGVDRLPVSESTPEEYGWLLNAVTGEFAFGEQAARDGVLDSLIDELAEDGDPTIVLKNPWDTCREQLLLDHFPGSQVILVRRDLAAIEDSLVRAWDRLATSNRYVRALIDDRRRRAEALGAIIDPEARQRVVGGAIRKMRRNAFQLARSVGKLPLDRVAFLSYDELCVDPPAGASWAAHLIDPVAFSAAFATHTFPEYNKATRRSFTVKMIDWYWARAWRRARAKQVSKGILRPPGAPPADSTGSPSAA